MTDTESSGMGNDGPASGTATPARKKAIVAAAPAGFTAGTRPGCGADAAVLRHLLALADRYRSEGARRQAMDIYWSLVDTHPDTREAGQARQRLLQLAGDFDQEGMHRAARDIYERLLQAGCDDHARA